MSKQDDLRLVMSVVRTAGLRALSRAIRRGNLIRGRFVDGRGGGCLAHWLSERVAVCRGTVFLWKVDLEMFDAGDAMQRLVVGWDAGVPDLIVQGPGYDEAWPKPTYILNVAEIRTAIAAALRARRRANRAEDRAVDRSRDVAAV